MGLFSQDRKKTVTTYDQTSEQSPITASRDSVATRGNAIFNDLGEGASQVTVKKGGRYVVRINQTSDPALLQNILTQQQQSLQQVLAPVLASQGTATAGLTQSLQDILNRVGDLAENKQTEGESGRNKTVLYIVLAAVAGLAIIFGKGRWGLYLAIAAAAYFLFGGDKTEST